MGLLQGRGRYSFAVRDMRTLGWSSTSFTKHRQFPEMEHISCTCKLGLSYTVIHRYSSHVRRLHFQDLKRRPSRKTSFFVINKDRYHNFAELIHIPGPIFFSLLSLDYNGYTKPISISILRWIR